VIRISQKVVSGFFITFGDGVCLAGGNDSLNFHWLLQIGGFAFPFRFFLLPGTSDDRPAKV